MHVQPPIGVRHTFVAVAATILLAATWAPPSAQSLADVARAEAARRAAVKSPGAVITDKDLAPTRPQPAPQAMTPGVPAGGTGDPKAAEAADDSAAAHGPVEDGEAPSPVPEAPERRDEQYWRARFTATRQAVSRAVQEATAVQARIRELDAQLEGSSNAARESELRQERAAATGVMGRLQKRVTDMQAELAALERFARSRSVPPDWTR